MFKLVEKGLTQEEFISKKQDIESNFDCECYWGQKENEREIDGVREAICYGENGEKEYLWYEEIIDENGNVTYNIYD